VAIKKIAAMISLILPYLTTLGFSGRMVLAVPNSRVVV
jgi:hypothetical protein